MVDYFAQTLFATANSVVPGCSRLFRQPEFRTLATFLVRDASLSSRAFPINDDENLSPTCQAIAIANPLIHLLLEVFGWFSFVAVLCPAAVQLLLRNRYRPRASEMMLIGAGGNTIAAADLRKVCILCCCCCCCCSWQLTERRGGRGWDW